MRGFTSLLSILYLHGAFPAITTAYQWPNPRYEALERFLYEGTDINNHAISILTNSCGKRVGDGPPVAAEWLRLAYHDSATYNITDGTGGMDASVYYELGRQENIGGGMPTSLNDFSASSNKYVSRADIIALGVVWGVASCAGPVIPFRGGRIDATVAGRFGVPQPQEILSTATERFRLQGFNRSEMIGLVACGHTLGGVRNLDFPTIVQISGPQLVLKEFDGTDAFDSAVVAQYLDGTTKNPLVTIRNTLFQSDLRIFSSDGNVTMRSLNSPEAFNAACESLLERMINTVPSNVQLTDQIDLIPFKVTRAQMTIQSGQLIFDVVIRVAVTAADQNANTTPRSITMFWCDARGANAGCLNNTAWSSSISHPTQFNDVLVSPVSSALQTSFVEFEVIVPIDAVRGVGRFWFDAFSAPGLRVVQDNEGAGYVLDDAVIFLPQMGSSKGTSSVVFDVVVGVLSTSTPTVATIQAYDNTFLSSASTPFTANATLVPVSASPNGAIATLSPTLLGYTLYSAEFTTPSSTAGHPTVDITVEVDGVQHTIDFARPLGPTEVRAVTAKAAVPTLGSVTSTTVSSIPTSALSATATASATAEAKVGSGQTSTAVNGKNMNPLLALFMVVAGMLGSWDMMLW